MCYRLITRNLYPKVYNTPQAVRNLMPLIGRMSCINGTLCRFGICGQIYEVYTLESNLKPDGESVFCYFCYACVISYFIKFLFIYKNMRFLGTFIF